MKIGIILPQTEIGDDPEVIRAYATACEAARFDHIAVYDHVLGASPDREGGWSGPYTDATPFHEVFVLLGFLAAVTAHVELVTEVLVLPQRQTALAAKQAAEVDVLSGGRLRLGVGVGWNPVEYQALGMSFQDRGRRIEEQIAVMRRLWAEDVVDLQGADHRIDRAGIRPRPRRGAIPVWLGGGADRVLQRAARVADGWTINMPPHRAAEPLTRLRTMLAEAGRDPASFGICGRVNLRDGEEAAVAAGQAWTGLGVTHISVNTMGAELGPAQQHVERARAIRDRLTASGGGGL